MTCRSPVAKNDRVTRKVCAVALAAALPLATLWTPPVHVHLGDGAQHVAHAHFSSHQVSPRSSDRPGLYRAKRHGDTLFLQLFVATAVSAFAVPLVAASPFELSLPSGVGADRPVGARGGHDPPILVSLPSRAPPARLS